MSASWDMAKDDTPGKEKRPEGWLSWALIHALNGVPPVAAASRDHHLHQGLRTLSKN